MGDDPRTKKKKKPPKENDVNFFDGGKEVNKGEANKALNRRRSEADMTGRGKQKRRQSVDGQNKGDGQNKVSTRGGATAAALDAAAAVQSHEAGGGLVWEGNGPCPLKKMGSSSGWQPSMTLMAVLPSDSESEHGHFVLLVGVQGVNPKDAKVEIENGNQLCLQLEATRVSKSEGNKKTVKWKQRYEMSPAIFGEEMQTQQDQGLLKVVLPCSADADVQGNGTKTAESGALRIDVGGGVEEGWKRVRLHLKRIEKIAPLIAGVVGVLNDEGVKKKGIKIPSDEWKMLKGSLQKIREVAPLEERESVIESASRRWQIFKDRLQQIRETAPMVEKHSELKGKMDSTIKGWLAVKEHVQQLQTLVPVATAELKVWQRLNKAISKIRESAGPEGLTKLVTMELTKGAAAAEAMAAAVDKQLKATSKKAGVVTENWKKLKTAMALIKKMGAADALGRVIQGELARAGKMKKAVPIKTKADEDSDDEDDSDEGEDEDEDEDDSDDSDDEDEYFFQEVVRSAPAASARLRACACSCFWLASRLSLPTWNYWQRG
jgi:hypothetical protein